MRSVDEIEAELIGPGGAFEIGTEVVLGEPIKVFKNRNRSLREIVENSANHGDNEYIICEGQRITFREHLARVGAVAHKLRHTYGVTPGRPGCDSGGQPPAVDYHLLGHGEHRCVFVPGSTVGGTVMKSCTPCKMPNRSCCSAIASAWRESQGVDLPFPVICIEDDFAALEQGWDAGAGRAPALPDLPDRGG